MSEINEVFRNAIDLNRYSNSVSRRLIRAYNDVVLDAVDQLRGIDELASPVKAARLRAILAQLNESLRTWSCLLYTSPSPRDGLLSRMPSSA